MSNLVLLFLLRNKNIIRMLDQPLIFSRVTGFIASSHPSLILIFDLDNLSFLGYYLEQREPACLFLTVAPMRIL